MLKLFAALGAILTLVAGCGTGSPTAPPVTPTPLSATEYISRLYVVISGIDATLRGIEIALGANDEVPGIYEEKMWRDDMNKRVGDLREKVRELENIGPEPPELTWTYGLSQGHLQLPIRNFLEAYDDFKMRGDSDALKDLKDWENSLRDGVDQVNEAIDKYKRGT